MSISVYRQAYNRINEKRSSVGSSALNLIKKHISTLNGDKEVKDWIRWALRVDGPLFFKTPSPSGSPTNQNDRNYQASLIFARIPADIDELELL